MSLQYEIVPVTAFQQNCSIIWCTNTNDAALVDPGGDKEILLEKISTLGINVTQILLTHGHLDHVGATADIANHFNIPVNGPHEEDAFWLDALPKQSQMFGFSMAEPLTPTKWLNDGDDIKIGENTLQVIHTPGHTPGHVIFYSAEHHLAWVGDVLFSGSVGRTDFPKGDQATLVHSIREKLFPLGDDITFIPGHGPNSTFGNERLFNPYVADKIPTW